MALALALIFILVLAGQSASASSIRQSVSNGQHKSSRDDSNSLSRNRRETWWWVTTKATKVELYGYDKSCYTDSDCSWLWSGLVCESRRCVCPVHKRPNYMTENCDYENDKKKPLGNFEIGLIVVISIGAIVGIGWHFVGYIKDSCSDRSPEVVLRPYREAEARLQQRWFEQESSSTNGLPPVAMSALTNTGSTLDVLDGQANFPPNFTDVYMTAPQEKADERDNGLPTYDEVVKRPEWNSQPVFVIRPHSSGDRPRPQSFGAAGAFAPSAPAISPPWEERDSSSTLRTDDHQSQNHDYHVDSSASDGYTSYDYSTNDYSTNDYSTNDYSTNDYSTNDYSTYD